VLLRLDQGPEIPIGWSAANIIWRRRCRGRLLPGRHLRCGIYGLCWTPFSSYSTGVRPSGPKKGETGTWRNRPSFSKCLIYDTLTQTFLHNQMVEALAISLRGFCQQPFIKKA